MLHNVDIYMSPVHAVVYMTTCRTILSCTWGSVHVHVGLLKNFLPYMTLCTVHVYTWSTCIYSRNTPIYLYYLRTCINNTVIYIYMYMYMYLTHNSYTYMYMYLPWKCVYVTHIQVYTCNMYIIIRWRQLKGVVHQQWMSDYTFY